MKLKIDKIMEKEVETKYGLKKKISYICGGQYYSAWANTWNVGWNVGDEIDVEVESREYNGKTYYDIKPPMKPEQKVQQDKLDKILENTEKILKKLEGDTITYPVTKEKQF